MTLRTITIRRVRGYIGCKPEEYTVEVLANIYGPFGVWRNPEGREDRQWEVIHLAVGLAVTNGHRNVSTARRIAKALALQPGWDFATQEEFAPWRATLLLQVQVAVAAAERRRGE